MFKHTAVIALMLASFSCTKKSEVGQPPKQRLKEYIEKSFSIKRVNEREELEEFLTGDARVRLAAWSEDQFEKAFITNRRKFSRLFFKEVKPISQQEVAITYELSFVDPSGGEGTKVTNKKVCNLIEKESVWYIKFCKNIKQLVEYQNEMSLP